MAGMIIGIGLAFLLTRLLGDLLYQVNPRDPLAFAVAFAAMTVASFAACFLLAWRATRNDPIRVLRADELFPGRNRFLIE
jgi:ABC-type antimicrobial peptide transport system permease subunit